MAAARGLGLSGADMSSSRLVFVYVANSKPKRYAGYEGGVAAIAEREEAARSRMHTAAVPSLQLHTGHRHISALLLAIHPTSTGRWRSLYPTDGMRFSTRCVCGTVRCRESDRTNRLKRSTRCVLRGAYRYAHAALSTSHLPSTATTTAQQIKMRLRLTGIKDIYMASVSAAGRCL